ncbi:limonene-1,2-epoxide hydrolase family protein [Actinomadura parmotrematis]|uniref:Nuclear transport factor 2 family protein n=1 Tax=Actinomadura parmotrematis TaxID=2864039 RepID=A0ABS7FYK2_9ACTN|nr:limonene-1,2-epoxide hydrolase family protein [Actinomadura parmotrematis]MBW8485524.1 nuclear transport factor 2 family protein [Actinomadura parmotrematis]
MTEIETVTAFLSALEDLDVDRALALCSPDIVYQNVPLPPARGIKAFERQMRGMARYGTGFEARLHNIAATASGTVLTERTDVLEKGAWRAEFWVCGTFELRDGKITLWRDYFDWPTFLAASAKGLATAALTSLRKTRTRPAARR